MFGHIRQHRFLQLALLVPVLAVVAACPGGGGSEEEATGDTGDGDGDGDGDGETGQAEVCLTIPDPDNKVMCPIQELVTACPEETVDYCDCECITEQACPQDGQQFHLIWENMGCVECHDGADANLNFMDLTHEEAFTHLVNRNSVESQLLRVTPGSLVQSYVWHKIRGSQSCPAGKADPNVDPNDRMPPSGALDPEDLKAIEVWICCGAQI